ncbi:MAG: zinc-ribbon domain-containing protein [Zoogloeaceae bacterium]|nr:zinc-ribbon domain-containing protein [Zoogloeaceae bacterium]
MLTRCPACQTVFKVGPDQLAARGGRVRCGHCLNAFDAITNALATDEPPPDDTSDEPAPPALAAEELPSGATPAKESEFWPGDLDAPGPAPAAPDDAPPPPREDAAPFEEAVPEPESREMPAVFRPRHRAPLQAEWEATDGPAALRDEQNSTGAPPDPSSEAELRPIEAPPAVPWLREASQGDNHREGSVAEVPAPMTLASAPALAQRDTDEGNTALAPPPSVMPLRVPAQPSSEPAARRTHRQWGIALGCLAVLLAAQAAFLFRTQVAGALPALRPMFVALCSRVGCAMPWPQEAGAIGIETSDLHPEPGPNAEFVFHATLRNRAAFAQAYPHVELSLTDAADKPVVRRVFAPQDWRQPGTEDDTPFSAGGTAEVRLAFSAPGVAALGYRVYVFYP